jgi:hypothetical protein
MSKISVHACNGKIELKIQTNGVSKVTLHLDEAVELGIKLLRAAYAAKS